MIPNRSDILSAWHYKLSACLDFSPLPLIDRVVYILNRVEFTRGLTYFRLDIAIYTSSHLVIRTQVFLILAAMNGYDGVFSLARARVHDQHLCTLHKGAVYGSGTSLRFFCLRILDFVPAYLYRCTLPSELQTR